MPKVLRAGDAWLKSWRRTERGWPRLSPKRITGLSAGTKVLKDEQNLTGVLLQKGRGCSVSP